MTGADRLAQARSPAAGRTGERHHRRRRVTGDDSRLGTELTSRPCSTFDRRSKGAHLPTCLLACIRFCITSEWEGAG
jgi:hypothetical protein